MATYPFLSDEWVTQAHALREEFEKKGGPVPPLVKMNLAVTEVPFGNGAIDAHLDTSEGSIKLDLGHIEPADLKVTVDYATAKSILVDGNSQAAMQAFMGGKIKVEGDIAKLMVWGNMPADPNAQEMAERLRAMTE